MSRETLQTGQGEAERILCDNCGTAVATEDADGWLALTIEPIISLSSGDVNIAGSRDFCGMGCAADGVYRLAKYEVRMSLRGRPPG